METITLDNLPKKTDQSFLIDVIDLAEHFGFIIYKVDYNCGMIQFKKANKKVNFYSTTKVVVHIKNGFSHNLGRLNDLYSIELVFRNNYILS